MRTHYVQFYEDGTVRIDKFLPWWIHAKHGPCLETKGCVYQILNSHLADTAGKLFDVQLLTSPFEFEDEDAPTVVLIPTTKDYNHNGTLVLLRSHVPKVALDEIIDEDGFFGLFDASSDVTYGEAAGDIALIYFDSEMEKELVVGGTTFKLMLDADANLTIEVPEEEEDDDD